MPDARYSFEDLSRVDNSSHSNPYDALIESSGNDPVELQFRYAIHRTTRNAQQKAKLLSPEFTGLILDPILQRLEDLSIEPEYKDPRNCLVFWARPPAHILSLVEHIQQKLLVLAPNLWLMPLSSLHMTTLEIIHSKTLSEVNDMISSIGTSAIATITDYTYNHRTLLIKPLLSYDCAALALSFVPASQASHLSPAHFQTPLPCKQYSEAPYTYHHLRRDLYNLARATGITIGSRYVVPSSHITICRFVTQSDHSTAAKRVDFVNLIEEINRWLEDEFWFKEGESHEAEMSRLNGEWFVGQEKGLHCRKGALWYGGGESVRIGKGF